MPTRIAAATDIPEIVRVTNAAYRVEDFFIDGNRTNPEEVAQKMAAQGSLFLVIDAEGRGLCASVFVEQRGERGYFGMLSVDPAHQKKGLSRALIDAIETHFRALRCVALDIDVVELREELPAFYARLGFTRTGTAPFLNPHRKRDTQLITMTRPL